VKAAFDRTDANKINDLSAFGNLDPTQNGWSKRQAVLANCTKPNNQYVTLDKANQITMADGSITESKIVSLDLRFGNLCNYKCIMCSPVHSNLWYEDWLAIDGRGKKKFTKEDIFEKGSYKTYDMKRDQYGRIHMEGTVAWWESDIWWKRFEEMIPNLRMIYFTGGEPLLVPAMQECLDRVIAAGKADQIVLRYDTNLSVINQKLIDKWKNFKRLNLCLSMDDVGDRYNLIRYPGNYNNFVRNIKTLQHQQIPIAKTTCCIGNGSIYTIKRVLDASADLGLNTTFRFLEGPFWLDIRALPRSAKYEIASELFKLEGSTTHKMWYNSEIEILRKYFNEENRTQTTEFVRVMNVLDERRNTNWKTTLPDIYDLFSRHCPEAFKA